MIFEIRFVIKVQHLYIYYLLEKNCTRCLFFTMVWLFFIKLFVLMNYECSFNFLEEFENFFCGTNDWCGLPCNPNKHQKHFHQHIELMFSLVYGFHYPVKESLGWDSKTRNKKSTEKTQQNLNLVYSCQPRINGAIIVQRQIISTNMATRVLKIW